MENKTSLLKIGNEIVFTQSGIHYEMKPGTVYNVSYDRYGDDVKLVEAPGLQMPNDLYTPVEDVKFMNKVINHYNKSNRTTGVMLTGTKGSGKTVMAKNIAMQSNLPIIVIDKSLRPCFLKTLFNKLENIHVCVIFDEIDKLGNDYDDDYLLQILDGISSSSKHLVIATCNDADDINECLIDRCGRIRYFRTFNEMRPSMIKCILNDRLDDKKKTDSLTDFIIKNFGCISFDNVSSFIEEVNEYPETSYEELFNDMNISQK